MTRAMADEPVETQNARLAKDISMLHDAVRSVDRRLRMGPMRLFGLQFLRGIAFGLGSVLGATLVVSLLIYSLASIDFIPIIGDWAAQIAERIRTI